MRPDLSDWAVHDGIPAATQRVKSTRPSSTREEQDAWHSPTRDGALRPHGSLGDSGQLTEPRWPRASQSAQPNGPSPTSADIDYAPPEPATSKGHKLDLYLPAGARTPAF